MRMRSRARSPRSSRRASRLWSWSAGSPNRAGDIGARALAFYRVDMADRGARQELGFHSVVQYAETRFGIRQHLDFYSPDELTEPLRRATAGMGIHLDPKSARMPALVRITRDRARPERPGLS